ncbi:excisionase [Serratia quinivorans]|uniref:excisionase n=1 Tax=Serratia quinivorans TaxID=137545 RepID=UPI00217A3912|nr:excisionase [Serratia quinivorans]CAI1111133.1 Excisionase-like protein [Serratia quinivorans]
MKSITLEEWAQMKFSQPYKLNTLRMWARTGRIYPAPEKVGRDWQVQPNAVYVNPKNPRDVAQKAKPISKYKLVERIHGSQAER